eukprot:2153028-Prymnesium_polylepis.2
MPTWVRYALLVRDWSLYWSQSCTARRTLTAEVVQSQMNRVGPRSSCIAAPVAVRQSHQARGERTPRMRRLT